MAGFDMENRDPNNLNEHLQVDILLNKFSKCYFMNLRVIDLTLNNN